VHPRLQPQHNASPGAGQDVRSTFIREVEAVDLAWSLKKTVTRAHAAGITDANQVCDRIEAEARAKPGWARQDGDPQRAEKWERVVAAMDGDPVGFRQWVERRLQWLSLSPADQQQRLDAGRRPVTPKQLKLIGELGGDVTIDDRWNASRAIDRLLREREDRRGEGAA
jgi:hypothetical protein